MTTTAPIQETKETFNIKESNFYRETYENGILIETEKDQKDEEYKTKFLNPSTLRWFRNLGGIEKVQQTTKFSLGCTLSTSISPDGNTKKLTYFFF